MHSLYFETTIYLLICLAIYFFEPQASYWLAYYHTGIEQFELWRLLTATFCHTNFNHLAMNMAGLVITLGLFIETFKKTHLLPLIIFNSLFIGLALFFFEAKIIWYVGFSGVLHGLFSFAVTTDIAQKDRWGYLLAVGLILKLSYEQFYGAAQDTINLIDAPVLVNAHFYGAIAGVIFYLIHQYIVSMKAKSSC